MSAKCDDLENKIATEVNLETIGRDLNKNQRSGDIKDYY